MTARKCEAKRKRHRCKQSSCCGTRQTIERCVSSKHRGVSSICTAEASTTEGSAGRPYDYIKSRQDAIFHLAHILRSQMKQVAKRSTFQPHHRLLSRASNWHIWRVVVGKGRRMERARDKKAHYIYMSTKNKGWTYWLGNGTSFLCQHLQDGRLSFASQSDIRHSNGLGQCSLLQPLNG